MSPSPLQADRCAAGPVAAGRTLGSAPQHESAPRYEGHVAEFVAGVDDLLDEHIARVRAAWAAELQPPDTELPHYPLDPTALLRDLVQRGGKRVRPALVHLGWVCGGGASPGRKPRATQHVLHAAAAVELLHVFALVHDDVMDESVTRRGRLTVHETAARVHAAAGGRGRSARFGESVAMLVGDLAHVEADRLAATLPAPMRAIWHALALELVAGQLWDLTGSADGQRSLAFARAVARQKSGNYTVTRPLQLGATAAGASAVALDALAGFGGPAGEAFALRDDLLGVFGDPRLTGKPAGDDLRSGKPTVLLAVAAGRLDGAPARTLAALGSGVVTDQELGRLQHELGERGVVAEVEAMIGERVQDAEAVLDGAPLDAAGAAALRRILHGLAHRGW